MWLRFAGREGGAGPGKAQRCRGPPVKPNTNRIGGKTRRIKGEEEEEEGRKKPPGWR